MARQFLGEVSHSLDDKGRIILPARFREALAEAFITSETDGCLGIWTPEDFDARAQEMIEKLKSTDLSERNVARFFYSGAQEVSPDRQGRLAIPPNLREFAGLEREVVIAGMHNHLEIWDAETWREIKRQGAQGMRAGVGQGMRAGTAG